MALVALVALVVVVEGEEEEASLRRRSCLHGALLHLDAAGSVPVLPAELATLVVLAAAAAAAARRAGVRSRLPLKSRPSRRLCLQLMKRGRWVWGAPEGGVHKWVGDR